MFLEKVFSKDLIYKSLFGPLLLSSILNCSNQQDVNPVQHSSEPAVISFNQAYERESAESEEVYLLTTASNKRQILQERCDHHYNYCLPEDQRLIIQEFTDQLWQVYFKVSISVNGERTSSSSREDICDPSLPPIVYVTNGRKIIRGESILSLENDGYLKIIHIYIPYKNGIITESGVHLVNVAQLIGHEVGHIIFDYCLESNESLTMNRALAETFSDLCSADLLRGWYGEDIPQKELMEATCNWLPPVDLVVGVIYSPEVNLAEQNCSPPLTNAAFPADRYGSNACRYERILERYNNPSPQGEICNPSLEELLEACSLCIFGATPEERVSFCSPLEAE